MAAPMASYVVSINPHRTLVINSTKSGKNTVLPFFLLRRAWILDVPLIPDDLVDFLYIYARRGRLEDVRDLDGSHGVFGNSLGMPLFVKTAV